MRVLSPQFIALITGLVAVLFLLGLLLSRRAAASPVWHWQLLLGIAILPGLALLYGTSATMESAKRPEFCGSCHVMHPFINDLKDPQSETLASIHYQNRYILENQCYTCHTEYTLFGPSEAKIAGMRHFWNYQTNNYELPIRLRTPYSFTSCQYCHGESRAFNEQHEQEIHELLQVGEVTCLDCHGPVHPEQLPAQGDEP